MKFKFAYKIIFTISTLILAGCSAQYLNPSQMVSLGAMTNPGQTEFVRSGNPDGTGGGVFLVPPAKVLVITRVIIQPMNLGTGTLDITLMQSDQQLGDRILKTWRVPNSQLTQLDFSPGYVVSSGSNLKIRNGNSSAGNDVYTSFYGYVTSDN